MESLLFLRARPVSSNIKRLTFPDDQLYPVDDQEDLEMHGPRLARGAMHIQGGLTVWLVG